MFFGALSCQHQGFCGGNDDGELSRFFKLPLFYLLYGFWPGPFKPLTDGRFGSHVQRCPVIPVQWVDRRSILESICNQLKGRGIIVEVVQESWIKYGEEH